MVGPLSVVVFRNQIDFAVIFAQIPVFSGNACPGLGSVGLEHLFRQFEECAVLCVGPCVQPVRSGTDQVDGTVHRSQGQVVVCKIIGPRNIVDFQLSVDFFGQDFIELGHHRIKGCSLVAGGFVAGGHVVDDNMFGSVNFCGSIAGFFRAVGAFRTAAFSSCAAIVGRSRRSVVASAAACKRSCHNSGQQYSHHSFLHIHNSTSNFFYDHRAPVFRRRDGTDTNFYVFDRISL